VQKGFPGLTESRALAISLLLTWLDVFYAYFEFNMVSKNFCAMTMAPMMTAALSRMSPMTATMADNMIIIM
jgi:hypothetical protein